MLDTANKRIHSSRQPLAWLDCPIDVHGILHLQLSSTHFWKVVFERLERALSDLSYHGGRHGCNKHQKNVCLFLRHPEDTDHRRRAGMTRCIPQYSRYPALECAARECPKTWWIVHKHKVGCLETVAPAQWSKSRTRIQYLRLAPRLSQVTPRVTLPSLAVPLSLRYRVSFDTKRNFDSFVPGHLPPRSYFQSHSRLRFNGSVRSFHHESS